MKIIYRCESDGYAAKWQKKLSYTLMSSIFIIIPTGIMVFCYANIVHAMRCGPAARRLDEPRVGAMSLAFTL